MIVADAVAWTGRRPWREEATEETLEVLRRNGAAVVPPSAAPRVYGLLQVMAGRAGMPVPVVVVDPKTPACADAQALPWANIIRVPLRTLDMDREGLAALMAHEMGHFSCGHGMRPEHLSGWLKPGSWMALAASLALGDLALILAALAAFLAVDLALRRALARMEEEADREAARLMGSVAPLLAWSERKRCPPGRWIGRATLWLGGYPLRRPWLVRMAADEVVAGYERAVGAAGSRLSQNRIS